MKNTLFAIGESLIDFIPSASGVAFDEIEAFLPKVGGAPANVLGAFAKLGGRTQMLTQLGDDPFGHKIRNALRSWNIGTDYIRMTDQANTALAFVSLRPDGNREFSFYRNPSADMLYSCEQIEEAWFDVCYGLHFCSVSLGDTPMKEAHRKAIEITHKKGGLVSFDLNLRFPLWKDRGALQKAVSEFMPYAHILKLSDEELEFVTGKTDIHAARGDLFKGNTELVLYTCGKEGAYAMTKAHTVYSPAQEVCAVDTTGAGDGFCGSFLYNLYRANIDKSTVGSIDEQTLKRYLDQSNRYCAASIQQRGAIDSYPTEL